MSIQAQEMRNDGVSYFYPPFIYASMDSQVT